MKLFFALFTFLLCMTVANVTFAAGDLSHAPPGVEQPIQLATATISPALVQPFLYIIYALECPEILAIVPQQINKEVVIVTGPGLIEYPVTKSTITIIELPKVDNTGTGSGGNPA